MYFTNYFKVCLLLKYNWYTVKFDFGISFQLQPLDSEIVPFHNKELSDAKAYAKKLNTVFLSDKKEEEKDKDEKEIIDLVS